MYGSRRRQLRRLSSSRVPVGHRQRTLCLQPRARCRTNYGSPYRCRRTPVVQNIQCYYLIPGTIVQVIKEDPARGMSEMRLGSVTRPLWTYGRFLSKHPIQDTYGVIETPESSGLIPAADPATVPELPSDRSTARTRPNGNP